MIKLGSKIKDKITGFTGVATARTEYYNGCVRYLIEGAVGKEGKMPDPQYFDEGQLEVLDETLVKPAPIEEAKEKGGPGRCEAPR